jgi:hypothetical protein
VTDYDDDYVFNNNYSINLFSSEINTIRKVEHNLDFNLINPTVNCTYHQV